MDITLLIALASVSLLILLSIGLFFKSQKTKENVNRARAVPNRIQNDGAPRRAQIQRNRGARMRVAAAQQQQQQQQQQAEDQSDEENAEDTKMIDAKVGAKKRAKLEAKAEKKAQREAEEQMRQERKKKEQQADEERKKAEEKEKAEMKRIEEEERKAREEKEQKEHEEYLKMKEAFNIEEEGYEEGEAENENLLQEFVNYIKDQKVVVIEDLAAKFKLKTQACIDRIKDLQNDDILTGVIDDRGKFIYVSLEEMKSVAKFIKQRGRVSISELAENSNKLITLTPSTVVNS